MVHSAGHLLASAGQAVGVLLQLGQARLRAAGFVQAHGVDCLGDVGECAIQLVHRRVEGLPVTETLELVSEVVDLVEAAVVTRGDEPLELVAGGAAGGIGVADRVALQRRQDRADPGEHVLDGGEVHAHGIAERVDAVDQLGGVVDVPHQLVAAVLGSHRGERVDQTLDAWHDLVDLCAHVAEAVGQRVGPGRQSVEVAGALVDLVGAVGQPGTDEPRLIRGPELRRHLAQGSGDAADQTDVRQLGDARSHLLQVREGLRCAQVMR